MEEKEIMCPALDYKRPCQACGKCEFCKFYFTNKINESEADCKGCEFNLNKEPEG